jgi:hypothetical protein
MPDFPRFDRDTLYNYVWSVVGKKVGYGADCDTLTEQICDAVAEWIPVKGDFWLEEPGGTLWVNKGWEVVTVDGIE